MCSRVSALLGDACRLLPAGSPALDVTGPNARFGQVPQGTDPVPRGRLTPSDMRLPEPLEALARTPRPALQELQLPEGTLRRVAPVLVPRGGRDRCRLFEELARSGERQDRDAE